MPPPLPPITIIGAGLSGLTLHLALRRLGIPCTLLDRAASPARNNYGITLSPRTYRSLIPLLQLDEAGFREKLAVNAQLGGARTLDADGPLRCHRGRLEEMMREQAAGVQGGKKVVGIEMGRGDGGKRGGVTAVLLEGGARSEMGVLVGADGVHSGVRSALSGAERMRLEVLPYAVFNGRRRVARGEFVERYRESLGSEGICKARVEGGVLLEVSVAGESGGTVDLSYVYSRPVRAGGEDPLFKPDRPVTGASEIPEAFFDEVRELHGKGLQMPFSGIFDVEKVREDRLLNWLMRCLKPDGEFFRGYAERNVVLIGDAAHAVPILQGQGGELAIDDALKLAEFIGKNGVDGLGGFVDERLEAWKGAVEDSKKRIEEAHSSDVTHL